MALTTTFMTTPIVNWIYPAEYHVQADEMQLTKEGSQSQFSGFSLLVIVERLEEVRDGDDDDDDGNDGDGSYEDDDHDGCVAKAGDLGLR
jgi:hypothetical protein